MLAVAGVLFCIGFSAYTLGYLPYLLVVWLCTYSERQQKVDREDAEALEKKEEGRKAQGKRDAEAAREKEEERRALEKRKAEATEARNRVEEGNAQCSEHQAELYKSWYDARYAAAENAATYEEFLSVLAMLPHPTFKRPYHSPHVDDLRATAKRFFVVPTRDACQVRDDDYDRGSRIDREFMKRLKLPLLSFFGCRCAMCGCQDNGCDIDHYFIPKAKGGNFVMLLLDGRLSMNAVPLCEACNRSKGKKIIEYSPEVLNKLKQFQEVNDLEWARQGHKEKV